jgi:hypothetical protein
MAERCAERGDLGFAKDRGAVAVTTHGVASPPEKNTKLRSVRMLITRNDTEPLHVRPTQSPATLSRHVSLLHATYPGSDSRNLYCKPPQSGSIQFLPHPSKNPRNLAQELLP